jgi:hypothetical protein
MNDLFIKSPYGAEFSKNRDHRYALWRRWHDKKPMVMFIGLNPSRANEEKTDPTITRIKNFAYDNGYGGFYMMNLFTYVTPYPKNVVLSDFDTSLLWIRKVSKNCQDIVFAWGAFIEARHRGKVLCNLYKAYCLGTNLDGSPKHPLYVKGNTKLQPYNF